MSLILPRPFLYLPDSVLRLQVQDGSAAKLPFGEH